jgi:hypothetical protein
MIDVLRHIEARSVLCCQMLSFAFDFWQHPGRTAKAANGSRYLPCSLALRDAKLSCASVKTAIETQ